ncbi:phosphoenolpyruvate synthase [Patescibacteria group bacterium]|jgi:pyruvate,water dikinase|nr:phosphoenolpyruvate synthase [Patescibacteria group bacterium]
MDERKIIRFADLTINDVPLVGGKNAALGEMVANLKPLGVNVPDGFAVTAAAYNHFLDSTGLRQRINDTLADLDTHNLEQLAEKGAAVRAMIMEASLPDDLKREIGESYRALVEEYGTKDVAVRSSATAEDLPGASFAGQQETYLNVVGEESVIAHTKMCIASLFTNRAISYRRDKGFSHEDAALSVGVQIMVRSDLAASGVMFSLDTETGFDKVVVIEGSYGLGEMVVQGKVTPDSYTVFKPSLEKGLGGVIAKDLGSKEVKMIYGEKGGTIVGVLEEERDRFCLTDEEASQLARWAVEIEKHFSEHHGHYQPMDMEWAKDGKTGELFIVQARPETIHSIGDKTTVIEYQLHEEGPEMVRGTAVGTKIASGVVNVIKDVKDIGTFEEGQILVTEITDPDWEPIMKIASAIVTDKGGRTSHAAIVSRELGIPCIVGCGNATAALKDGDEVTVDCSSGKEGRVLRGLLPFGTEEHRLDEVPELDTKMMVNVGSPHEAFKNHYLPVKGVGLGRLEFIINSHIRVHPNALFHYQELQNSEDSSHRRLAETIDRLTPGYEDKTQYYVDELAEGIAMIAAAFYPHDVIIRFSDFKTNEYRTLIGGELYEPEEANPMIGWRGTSRYYSEAFRDAFGLECKAMAKVRYELGLDNAVPMVPFCRTLDEADKVLYVMSEHGLDRVKDDQLKVYVMCEVPSNVILANEFLDRFDGMSIGSNDLTQLVLGLDRDSAAIAAVGNEQNQAVLEMMEVAITACKERGKYIGICGQAPSDFPDIAAFLIERGIESISLSPDTVIKSLPLFAETEAKRHA